MTRKPLLIFIVIAMALAAVWFAATFFDKSNSHTISSAPDKEYSKIISLAPNITEILFALGLGDKVIGVSQYCDYPPQAASRPRFGALMNPSYEAIIAAEPDVVIATNEMLGAENKFAKLGIKTIAIKHDTIEEILESITLTGRKCNAKAEAEKLVAELKNRVEQIRNATGKKSTPKVLICIGHKVSPDADSLLENIYIAGNDGFYSQMLDIIGSQNAYQGNIAFPKVGYETILKMNPDIIIDTMSFALSDSFDKNTVIAQWKNFSDISAVENSQIYVLGESYMAIPGPRFIITMEKLARVIHPEIVIKEKVEGRR